MSSSRPVLQILLALSQPSPMCSVLSDKGLGVLKQPSTPLDVTPLPSGSSALRTSSVWLLIWATVYRFALKCGPHFSRGASPGSLLEMQTIRPYLWPTKSTLSQDPPGFVCIVKCQQHCFGGLLWLPSERCVGPRGNDYLEPMPPNKNCKIPCLTGSERAFFYQLLWPLSSVCSPESKLCMCLVCTALGWRGG